MEDILYQAKQKEMQEEFEAKCRRCGACCGVYDRDPCLNLSQDKTGKYYCRSYANRLGRQTTVSGRVFTCVPIRDLLKFDLPYRDCGYIAKSGIEDICGI